MSDRCPYDLCDGSGFLFDEESNTAFDCRCRPQRVAQAKARSLSAVIPRRYRDVAFDRWPVTEIEPQAVVATTRARGTLGWTPTHSELDTIIATAWNWHRRQNS